MYKTELERHEREIILEILSEYDYYLRLNEDPSMRIEALLCASEEEINKKIDRAWKRYNLLTEEEKRKYKKEYEETQAKKYRNDKGLNR